MSRPKCPVTETARPNRPDRIGQTETAQTESAWPKSRVPPLAAWVAGDNSPAAYARELFKPSKDL